MINEVEKIIIDWLKSDNENTTQLAYKICKLIDIIKRFKIKGTSILTGNEKWFEFDEEEWNNFQRYKRWSGYPAWVFDDNTIKEI